MPATVDRFWVRAACLLLLLGIAGAIGMGLGVVGTLVYLAARG